MPLCVGHHASCAGRSCNYSVRLYLFMSLLPLTTTFYLLSLLLLGLYYVDTNVRFLPSPLFLF